jgi:3-oxoacyl-[acyl-carrier protein] reductase
MNRPVALVTGGSRGIGKAVVLELAAQGYDIGFCYRSRAEEAAKVELEATSRGAAILTAAVDVTDAAAVRQFVERTEGTLGPIQTAITSAGIIRDRHLVRMEDAEWDEVIRTNLDGAYNVCRSVIYPMMKRKEGSIIALSSAVGVYGNAGQANYAAAKAGIIGLTRSVAKEYGRFGVRANVVAPGFIDTDMTAAMEAGPRAAAVADIPLRRFGEPEEVAYLVAFLASSRAAYINGAVVHIDGGVVV